MRPSARRDRLALALYWRPRVPQRPRDPWGVRRDVRDVRGQIRRPVLSIDLAGGRRSLIRTRRLDVGPRELAQELRRHLTREQSESRLRH